MTWKSSTPATRRRDLRVVGWARCRARLELRSQSCPLRYPRAGRRGLDAGACLVTNRLVTDAGARVRTEATGAQAIIDCGLVPRSAGFRGFP
jgi:hypothetical protein